MIARAPARKVASLGPDAAHRPGHGSLPGSTSRSTPTRAVELQCRGLGRPVRSWRHAARVKAEAGQGVDEMAVDIEDGARLLERAAAGVPAVHRRALGHAVDTLRDETLTEVADRLAPALSPNVVDILTAHPLREHVTVEGPNDLWVDRERALSGSWYELFPRSEGARLRSAQRRLVSGTFPDCGRATARRRRDGFSTSCTCPPSTRSARSTARDPTTPWPPGRTTRAPPGRSGPATAATTPSIPTWVSSRTSTRSWPGPRPGHGSRHRSSPPMRARPPVGGGTPGTVHPQERRIHRLRGEPAQEIPGHLPGQLRQRPGRDSTPKSYG